MDTDTLIGESESPVRTGIVELKYKPLADLKKGQYGWFQHVIVEILQEAEDSDGVTEQHEEE